MRKTLKYIAIAIVIGILLSIPQTNKTEGEEDYHLEYGVYNGFEGAAIVNSTTIFPIERIVKVTAYSSREQETDSTPFITASGTRVRDGIVAANWLPIGTKVRIPEAFGDKIFTVEDRMHKRNSDKLDIWFASTKEAFKFGVQELRVEILL
ncbi:MAG TPA: hypothetical protein VI432_01035 [Candidatus Paceibacterota bacterium]